MVELHCSAFSWFMRCLNEYIARRANKEDDCKGRFWEGRFKSQALVDEGALLACMVYVDLNPVRAGLAATPEESEFTSIWERLQDHHRKNQEEKISKRQAPVKPTAQGKPSRQLIPFQQKSESIKPAGLQNTKALPLAFADYLELLDWTGRQQTSGNKAAISASHSPILDRLKLNHEGWFQSVTGFEGKFSRVAGKLEKLKELGQKLDVKWLKGQSLAMRLYLAGA